jgi:hypothetical protein
MTELEQELLDRIRVLERWAVAHEIEQWQHRVFLAENGRNREKFKEVSLRAALARYELPGARGEKDIG